MTAAITGPQYPYYKYIKSPQEIGMSSKGTLDALGKDVDGLVEYINLLVSGKSKASATGKPLGNKFFLKTGASCQDNAGTTQDRYVYINNVPTGNIPIVSSASGMNFSDFKGLVPGLVSNLNAFNPSAIMQAFTEGGSPVCQAVSLETIDTNNQHGTETHYITVTDIGNMDPCEFPNKINPITKQKCREGFGNVPNRRSMDLISKTYMTTLGLFGIYVLWELVYG